MSRFVRPEDLGGENNCIQYIVPPGIGDLSWLYSKIKHIPQIMDCEVILYTPSKDVPRAQYLVDLLPGMHNGGPIDQPNPYVTTRIKAADGIEVLTGSGLIPICMNAHLENGNRIERWIPHLACDLHYDIDVPCAEYDEAERVMAKLRKGSDRVVVVYVSGRHTEAVWDIWSDDDWVGMLHGLRGIEGFRDASYLFMGADYDRDKMEAIMARIEGKLPVAAMIARPLGAALTALGMADYCLSFPSGIGIMANVLETPCLMLLPHSIARLAGSYADPDDLASGRYRAWVKPTVAEALCWLADTGARAAGIAP